MLMSPPRCWRNLPDCQPMHSVEGGLPEDPEAFLDFMDNSTAAPPSFVCGGCVSEANRAVPQDAYRLCWVNGEVDEMGEYDEQDIAHQMAVLSQMLGIIAARRTASGHIDVPADAGGFIRVETEGGD